MKENSIEEYIKSLEDFSNESVLYGSTVGMTLEKYKDLQLSTEHILSDYKSVLKENEELKQDRNNNYQMIALAQNEALGYMQGYEDGKKLKRSAVANIVENQQYYIIKKQIEKYETYIEQLRKELGQKDKIIDLMADQLTTPIHDKKWIKKYYENKVNGGNER
nr:MAG TPA: hypothetical protein [Caudoviricetes sp.]